MSCIEECQSTETVGGLEVSLLGEAQTTQQGTFQVAARYAEQAVKARICGTTSRV